MNIEETAADELTETTVRKLSKAKNEPDWLLQTRLNALRQFEQLQMPQFSYGLHVIAPLNINIEELRPLETITHHNPITVNDVIIEDLSVAAAKYENILRPLITGSGGYRDKLEALFAAFWNGGIFIYAPRQKQKGEATQVRLGLNQKQTTLVAVVAVSNSVTAIFAFSSATTTMAAISVCFCCRFSITYLAVSCNFRFGA